MRLVALALAAFALVSFAFVAPASAGPVGAAAVRRAAELPPPELLGGVTVTGATVKTPGKPTRKLSANQATAFMQAWFPDSVFDKLPNVPRPKKLVISTLAVGSSWHGISEPLTVEYAVSGTSAYVGMPPQGFGWASVTSEKWIIAPQSAKLMKAFAGQLQPDRSGDAPPTTLGPPTKTTSSSSSAPWFILGGGIIVVIGGVVAFEIRRRQNL